MGLFSKKQEVNLEDFCRNFYETQILNPLEGKIDATGIFSEVVKKQVVEIYPEFAKVDSQKLKEELIILRFEMFALAWTHKFITGKILIDQSIFTKHYLHEKGRDDIWNGMEHYNKFIDSATLHWLTNLGKFNLPFNYNMREKLTSEITDNAKELRVEIKEDSIERVKNRLWSESAWRREWVLKALVLALCKRLELNPNELSGDVGFRLAVAIKGFYYGSYQSFKNVKIKN